MDLFEISEHGGDGPAPRSAATPLVPASRPHEVPADVRLLAAVARLLDFHQTKNGSAVSVPETPESAGRHLTLAIGLLQTLGRLEIENGQSRISLNALHAELSCDIGIVTHEELIFCIVSLAMAREIRYDVPGGDGEVVHARTSDTTTLVTYDPVLRQVALTENARLLLRVTSLRESWLYSDVDAQRLIKAIQRGQFHDVPRFCREMVRDLAAKARQIADVTERPTLADLRDALISDGANISATLGEATLLVQQAMALLFAEQTAVDFNLWRATRAVEFSIGNLQAELEIVLQSTESLARRFVQFVKDAQGLHTLRMPTMRFVDICRSLTDFREGGIAQIEAATADVLPWMPGVRLFSPAFLVNEVDLASMMPADECICPPVAFENVSGVATIDEPTHEFLRRNGAVIVDALKNGPMAFSALLASVPLQFEPDETQANLIGAFTFPEVFDADGTTVHIGHRAASVRSELPSSLLLASDPLLSLQQEPTP